VMAFYFSLTRWTLLNSTFIGLDNYVSFLGDARLMAGLRNTLIYAVLTSGLKVIISLPLAMLLTSNIRLKGLFRGIIFFPVLVSTVAVGITFSVLMQPSVGLINTVLGFFGLPQPQWLGNPDLALYSVALVDVWKGIGIAMVIFMAGILSIPQDYFDTARLEGGTWVKFRHVIIPLSRNATFTVILLSDPASRPTCLHQ
jgi:raffinose/stachyose/melibiose transport system permease protein